MKKNLLIAVTVCALSLFAFVDYNCAQAKNQKSSNGFTLSDTQGNKVMLSNFKDKPVLLFFWTTWCPHCRTALKGLEERREQMRENGVEVLLIDTGEEPDYITKFVKKNNITYPVLLDTTNDVAMSYDVVGVPTFVLINKTGEVVYTAHTFPSGYEELIK